MSIVVTSPALLPLYPATTLSEALEMMLDIQTSYVFHDRPERHWLAVLWAAHTHGMSQWHYTPRLYITAPEPACGKSTQLDVLGLFSDAPLRGSSVTGAALFRALDVQRRAILLDEADETLSGSKDGTLRAMFNDGYDRKGTILRATGEYPAYAAMVICGIGTQVPDATKTRTIPMQMSKGTPAVDYFDAYEHQDTQKTVLDVLADASLYWDPKTVTLPEGCNARQAQIWRPLFAVAEAAGARWVARAHAAYRLCQWESTKSIQSEMLRAIADWFADHEEDRVTSSVLAAHVSSYDHLPKTSPKALATRMKTYGVQPRKVSSMVYLRDDLAPVFKKWL